MNVGLIEGIEGRLEWPASVRHFSTRLFKGGAKPSFQVSRCPFRVSHEEQFVQAGLLLCQELHRLARDPGGLARAGRRLDGVVIAVVAHPLASLGAAQDCAVQQPKAPPDFFEGIVGHFATKEAQQLHRLVGTELESFAVIIDCCLELRLVSQPGFLGRLPVALLPECPVEPLSCQQDVHRQ